MRHCLLYYVLCVTHIPDIDYESIRLNRAMSYLKLNKYEAAISDCDSVLHRNTKDVKALYRRGTAYK